ncbi:unnamed protein product [Fraxinus pennsylvanica]|uniref:Cation/H+ exchanger transmembrane domain-containing protein n=1 Tax=Fraxinus pennsylvanica TaxID=56036 RepID=A0AAD2DWI3_9LAMI|nr:unnamed protein product [Fraxinus pennsylvanica]
MEILVQLAQISTEEEINAITNKKSVVPTIERQNQRKKKRGEEGSLGFLSTAQGENEKGKFQGGGERMEFLNRNYTDFKNMEARCTTRISYELATIAVYTLGFFFLVFLCNFLHIFLRPMSQPRIIPESIVGRFLSNMPFIRKQTNGDEIQKTLTYIVEGGMICHMFVVGLEIDPHIFLQIPLREAKVACSGVLTTIVIGFLLIPFLNVPETQNVTLNICLSVILSGTASPLLARLITDLKIGKSDIGRFVVSAGVHCDPSNNFYYRYLKSILRMTSLIVIETVLVAKVTPLLMNWVNRENPDGKSMKGSHLVVSVAFVVMMKLTSISTSIYMVFVTLVTIVYLLFVVTNIIDRARKHSPTQRMAL